MLVWTFFAYVGIFANVFSAAIIFLRLLYEPTVLHFSLKYTINN